MQRKPGFPPTTCNIKVPDCAPLPDPAADDEGESLQRRQQLINFGHSQWGFNNWSWSVTKQDLDFVDYSNGKYSVGVVAFVSISVKIFDIHRENIGYATAVSIQKGLAIYKARKCAVTNALRETLLSFGGSVATELMELDSHKPECNVQLPAHPNISTNNIEPHQENNQNLANKPALLNADPKIPPNKHSLRKDSSDSNSSKDNGNIRSPHASVLPMQNTVKPLPTKATPVPQTKPGVSVVPSVCQPRPPAPIRPNSNVSFVLQPVIPPMYAPHCPPRMPQHVFPNYYEYGPWHYYGDYDRHHGNVNLNFNMPPKNLVVNSRSGTMDRPRGPPDEYMQQQGQGCWVKPGIFYDGFWTEQKVKKWVAEQVEKQFPDDMYRKSTSPGNGPATGNGTLGHNHNNEMK